MIVQPDLVRHPKYLMFKAAIGDLALEYLLRLWAHSQTSRKGGRLGKVNGSFVEAICEWRGEPGRLFAALTDKSAATSPWIEQKKDGALVVHGWDELNYLLLNSWRNGRYGGRQRTTHKKPTDKPRTDSGLSHDKPTDKPKGSSGAPEKRREEKSTEEREKEAHLPEVSGLRPGPTVQEVIDWGAMDGVAEDDCRAFHAHYAGLGWMYGNTRMTHPRHWLTRWGSRSRSLNPSGSPAKKKGETVFEKKTRKENLAEYLKNHPANPEQNFSGTPSDEERADFQARKKEYEQLTRELATGASALPTGEKQK